MGIKTKRNLNQFKEFKTLKNLPTTWGLRQSGQMCRTHQYLSEKPPHHMGIKTLYQACYRLGS